MADNFEVNAASGGDTFAADEIGAVKHQRVKVQYGVDGAATDVSDTNPLPVDDAGGSLTMDNSTLSVVGGGTEATAMRVTLASDSTGVVSVDDGGGAITIDWAGTAPPIGAGLEATALRVTVATDSTGVLTVDNGGTFAVQADSVIPGIGATNLGKAIDSAVGGTDTGVALLAKHVDDNVHITPANGDYAPLEVDSRGALASNIEQHHTFDTMNATTGWTALGNDTTNLATTTIHAVGTNALTFDKADGAANTVFAGIQKTVSSTDLGSVSPHDLIQTVCYTSDTTNIDYIFVRVGTDSSNYNEWRIDGANLFSGEMEIASFSVGDLSHSGSTGTGWDPSAITYIAIGVAFASESDTLTGIIFDEISYHTNTHTSASIQSEVTSSVSSSNVNLQKVGGSATAKNSGNLSNGTQRVAIATDDVNMSAIKTAVEGATPTGTNLIGDVGVSGARTSGGTTLYKNIDVDESEDQVKGSAGQIYWIHAMNLSAAVKHLKIYNATAASVTVGTTVPDLTFPIPTQGDTNGAGFTLSIPNGIAFGTAITIAATTGIADGDSGAPGANEVVVNLGYA